MHAREADVEVTAGTSLFDEFRPVEVVAMAHHHGVVSFAKLRLRETAKLSAHPSEMIAPPGFGKSRISFSRGIRRSIPDPFDGRLGKHESGESNQRAPEKSAKQEITPVIPVDEIAVRDVEPLSRKVDFDFGG